MWSKETDVWRKKQGGDVWSKETVWLTRVCHSAVYVVTVTYLVTMECLLAVGTLPSRRR